MNPKHTVLSLLILSLLMMFSASCLFAQTPYDHDISKAEELRVRDGLPNFFQKLKAGEDITVGYIGGSITNGGLWRSKTFDWLKSEYPKAKLKHVNAAIGGTGPDFGACRIGNHLLAHDPDMIFIEYRVNDGGAFQGRAFEGLIPQIWNHNPNAEICIVYTIAKWMLSDIEKGKQTSAGRPIEAVANHYGITSIDFGLEVVKQLNENKLVFQANKPVDGKILFSKDGVHPVEAGHDIYRDIVVRSFKAIEDHGTAGANVIPKPLKENAFSNATMVPVTRARFSAGWQSVDLSGSTDINADLTDKNGGDKTIFDEAMKTDSVDETLTLQWDGFMLGLTAVLQGKDQVKIEVSTDGGPAKIYDLASRSGNRQSKYIFTKEVGSGSHTTIVKVVSLAEGKSCQLGQFLVVGE
ncbi:hypothetical protein CA13_17650 [Planctomycetes bacterium CA13]|uniref:SGNH hydrolase-type esterase domain-containing protein n=1 Tax=Novipirellula herctigrandis TaxID=2527986 RepID=A0A5C5YZ19_9BACT|nr:hypothetical protein CA13_17650 [Planctomycetes bacterium CA13]